ncbi:MAG: hypothetical protein KGZ97_13845 [Bacteroidetes bacterium]|nr:hypothetical protein [Bacteroidota bacterium]
MKVFLPSAIVLLIFFHSLMGLSQSGTKSSDSRILHTTASKYEKCNISTPTGIKAYYSEIAKINSKYVSFTEAAGVLVSFGHDCIIPANSLFFAATNMRKSDRKETWLKYISENYVDYDNTGIGAASDYQPEVNALLNSFRWFEMDGPLSRKNAKRFHSQINILSKSKIEVQFKPKSNDNSIKYNYEGSIYINSETNEIDSINLLKCKRYSYQHNKFVLGWMRIVFEWNDDKCWPKTIISGYNIDEIELVTTFKTLSTKPTYINLEKDDFNLFLEFQISPVVMFESSYWEQNDFVSKNTLQQIEKDIGSKRTLNQQFKENSNQPYRVMKLPNGEIFPNKDCEKYIFYNKRIGKLLELID